jgi:hypothetical protein
MDGGEYFDEDFEHSYSGEDFETFDRDTKKRLMEVWFRRNYEDPANRLPYESAEGGYQWIWGGPYYAHEVLQEEFEEIAPTDLIEELVQDLQAEGYEWTPTESPEDYDDYVVDDIASITEFYQLFADAVLDIERLLDVGVPEPVQARYLQLLYVNVISAMESYLSEAFISTTLADPEIFRTFIETTPEFQAEKISVSDIFKEQDGLKSKANEYLAKVAWHNLAKVRKMYQATFGIRFPEDIGNIYRAILIRHDLVHRNGKNRDGVQIQITREQVIELIRNVEHFIQEIDGRLE